VDESPDQFCGECGNPRVPNQQECPYCGNSYDQFSHASLEIHVNLPEFHAQERTLTSLPASWGDTPTLLPAGGTPPVLPGPMLDKLRFPGKWGQQITAGVFIVMTSDFAALAIKNIFAGHTTASVWWVATALAGCYLLGEKVVVRKRQPKQTVELDPVEWSPTSAPDATK